MQQSKHAIAPSVAYARLFGAAKDGLPGAGQPGLAHFRDDSLARFLTQGFPTQKVEAWKYTGLSRIAREDWALAAPLTLAPEAIRPWLVGGAAAPRLVFVNGHLAAGLSSLPVLPGLRLAGLAERLEADGDALAPALADGEALRSLSALNAAFMAGGAWIEVEEGVEIAPPLQLLFVTVGGGGPQMCHPRNLIRLGRGARLSLVETHLHQGEGKVLTNLVNLIEIGTDATLLHDRLQLGRPGFNLLGRTNLVIRDRGRVEQTLATLGCDLIRNETHALLDGSEVVLHLNGTYLPKGEEHVDNQIWIDHAKPRSESYQFYKGVLDGRSRAVFAGKISVRRPAQKTNAFQKNDNLLLSNEAEIDTKPELEIFADDVKCSHGATAGELDAHEIFYLRSRGLPAETARAVLTYAFTGEVIERFARDEVKAQLRRELQGWLPGIEEDEVA